ncbi:Putative inner membrane protein [Salmonella enterica subsp. enterica]|uniref:Inner membrane protein n=1 Tax=Salmonella enterica I TaxID=59201 RepID=A0A447U4Y8_SALET|nr:Putative inner membrane protein [Salmonella enterica subsp. enterica]
MAIWLDQGVQSWMRHLLYAPGSNKNPVTLVILGMILRVLVWSMMLLSILANVGVDITALVASLGVGRYCYCPGGTNRSERCLRFAIDWFR